MHYRSCGLVTADRNRTISNRVEAKMVTNSNSDVNSKKIDISFAISYLICIIPYMLTIFNFDPTIIGYRILSINLIVRCQ